MLEDAILEAEAIYLGKADELARFHRTYWKPGIAQPVDRQSIDGWLQRVVHTVSRRHRKLRTYATAYYVRQEVVYNHLYIASAQYPELLDTVLHELGHLFTYHFFRKMGHDFHWRNVGHLVGYAPVGATSMERRKRYIAFAAHEGAYAAESALRGRLNDTAPLHVNRTSAAFKPVQLAHIIFDENPSASRNEVLALCVAEGININTARTQYYHWRKNNGY